MSSANTLTGRHGKHMVGSSLVARLTEWAVNPSLASSSEWGDSDSEGFTCRAPGRKGATFNTGGKYDTSDEVFDLFQPEDIAIGVLWLTDYRVTSGEQVLGSARSYAAFTDLYWDFPRALCNDFNLTVNIDSQEVIGWTSGWGNDGPFYRPGQSGATARTLP